MLARRDPFREMMTLRNAMDRLFDSAFVGPFAGWSQEFGLALDVTEKDEEYLVKASVPGIDPDDLDITYENGVLTIRGEIKAEEEKEGETYHLRERRYGSFSRSVSLPSAVDQAKIDASYQNGVLTLHLPKAEEARPRRIQVKKEKLIEAKASDIRSKN